ncbi:hypothetical protein [Yunchengibacter salinarum]|uniref:hypothetical protein n=1 Tax=Yunchengibacter salinarum TaxID=3133399 RepID=UPI0035B689E5
MTATPHSGRETVTDRFRVFADHHTVPSPETPMEERARVIESALITAVWTLRRLPDRDRAFLFARQVMWPEIGAGETGAEAGGRAPVGSVIPLAPQGKRGVYGRQARPDAKQIDAMQPALDLLALVPDQDDRQILFWAAWHQNGAPQSRIPWARVAQSVGLDLSRWTYKRRYGQGLDWLARLCGRAPAKKIQNS